MSKSQDHSAIHAHNAVITAPIQARPRILIPATGRENDGIVLRMRSEGPQRIPADLEGKKFFAEWGIEWFEGVKEFAVGEVLVLNDQDRARLQGLSLLRYAHETFPTDAFAAAKAVADAAALLIEDKKLQPLFSADPQKVALSFYPAFFTKEIKGTQAVMWCTADRQFLPAIYCPTRTIASFLAVSYRGLAACLNCYKIFSPDAPGIDSSTSGKYCTAACGQRYRQKLYRLRVSQQAKSKRKAGTR